MARGEYRELIRKYRKLERTRQTPRSVQRKRDMLEKWADKLIAQSEKTNGTNRNQ